MIALVAGSSFAATGDDFYETLYRRGVSDFNEGKYEAARRELRIAAFGLIESVSRYETVHAYLVATSRRLDADGDARVSLLRILNAEKIERHFATLSLPAPVREAIDTAARALLTREEAASLRAAPGAAQAAAAAPGPASVVPAPPEPQSSAAGEATTTTAADPQRTSVAPPATAAPAAVVAQPAPVPPSTAAVKPQVAAPPKAAPAPPSTAVANPQPVPPSNAVRTPAPSTSPDGWRIVAPAQPVDIAAQLRTGDAAIARGDLVAARSAYNAALASPSLSHADALRIAEGLYRARDFRGTVTAFNRAGTIARGEEPYRYYLAVALYETGQYAAAKRELTAVLPFIEATPDVARYEAKIRAAIE